MEDHYNDASTSCVTYATSSTRDEPFVPSMGTTRYDPLGRLVPSTSYKFPKEFEHYQAPQSRPLVPGLTTRHTLTMEHPLVTRFLARVPSIPHTLGRISGEDWWTKALHSWTVNGVLDLTDADGNEVLLSEFQEECVFVLAALKVFYYPRHPKHFAMWGKDWAARTAERIHALLLMKPCPIAYSYNWMSVEICLWMIEEHQSYTFGENKEGKKAANGMLLRKRKSGAGKVVFDPLAGKSIEGVTDERPRKRVRTSARTKKTVDVAPPSREPEAETVLEALPLSGVVVSLEQPSSGSSTAVSPDSEAPPEPTKDTTKLELTGVDAPQPASIIASSSSSPRPSTTKLPPPTTRRSARQAHKHKRGETASPSTPSTHLDSPTSEITSLGATPPPASEQPALPPPLSLSESETKGGSEERPVITRSRSSSSSCASEVTVVSDAPSVESVVTVVDEEASENLRAEKSKIVEVIENDDTDKQKDKENEKEAVGKEVVEKVRASGRTRRPAVKKVEAEDALVAAGEKVGVEVLPGVKGRSRRRVGGRR